MRRAAAIAILFGSLAVPAGATPPIGDTQDHATVLATPAKRAARPVVLTLRLHYEMLCAQPGRGPVVVTLPSGVRMPSTIRPASVVVGDKTPPSVEVDGHVVTIALAPNSNVICQSFVPGMLKIVFTKAARIGNPLRAGTYRVRARIGSHTFAARLAIAR
jgi:hypothetical protein